MGIETIGDLASYPEDILKKKLGKMGDHFYKLAHGIDNRQVRTGQDVKSVSNEHTFSNDLKDGVHLRKRLSALCEKVGFRLRKHKLAGKTIHLKLRYFDFSTITRNRTIASPTSETEKIFKTITSLFEKNYTAGQAIRLIGVGVSSFEGGLLSGSRYNVLVPMVIVEGSVYRVRIKKGGASVQAEHNGVDPYGPSSKCVAEIVRFERREKPF